MPTSSFKKDFTLDSRKAVESFVKILSNPCASVKLERGKTTAETMKRGEEKLKQMLSR